MGSTGVSNMGVVSNDIDVFLLFLHYYTTEQLTCGHVRTRTSRGRTSVDIKDIADKHRHIIPDLIAAHVLFSCDTVTYLWGIRKTTCVIWEKR